MTKSALEVLKCPECNGNVELDDNQEYGFCKYCGTKVQNTNFKIIRGEVTIKGNPTVENYLKLANRYYKDGNYSDALINYDKALVLDADNWEAVFKRGICSFYNSNFLNDAIKSANNAIDIINSNNELKENIEQIKIDMAFEIIKVCSEYYIIAMDEFNRNSQSEYAVEVMWNKLISIVKTDISIHELLLDNLNNDIKTTQTGATKNELLISIYDMILSCCANICDIRMCLRANKTVRIFINNQLRKEYVDIFDKYTFLIKQLDPNHRFYFITRKPGTGCYVATCIYGSYDCPQVWTLRRYRDYTLSKTWYGRLFIKTYYTFSPTIIKLFGNFNWFKKMWKPKLDKIVNKLQKEGYDASPYNDLEW